MKILECKDESEWVASVNNWLAENVRRFQARRVFLPAGETPRPLYRDWESSHGEKWRNLQFVQIDDVLTGAQKDVFRRFFVETLPSYQKQVEWIDQAGGGADLALLGIGMNGHVGFHEPGLAKEFYSGCLTLNRETVDKLKWPAQTKVVTYGVGSFLKSKAILLMVRGESKKNILQKFMTDTGQLPAGQLKSHPQLTVITDFSLK